MDADLFMECEEEELEPWQQQYSMDEPMDDTQSESPTREKIIVPSSPYMSTTTPAKPKTVMIPKMASVVNAVPLLTSTLASQVVSTALSANIPKAVQGQQVIVAPSAGGLNTVALSQVLLPGTSSVPNPANNQQIYFTTQGLPVQNICPVQSGQRPMGLVLNVQQGQTVRPITLVQAPGTQIFKSPVGSTQIISHPSQIRSASPVAKGTFSTVQIPAALAIHTTTAVTCPVSSTTVAKPSASQTTTKIVTLKPGSTSIKLQNLMSLMKSVNLPGAAQAQTFVIMSNQKSSGPAGVSSVPVSPQAVLHTIPVTKTPPSDHLCSLCGVRFKTIKALRSHMCFCCPDAKVTITNKTKPPNATDTQPAFPKTLTVVPKVTTESQPTQSIETPARLVMLVDDFYYGTFEGNRVRVPKKHVLFKCLSCNKSLKNNIRLMSHMKCHVEPQQQKQQNGWTNTHTSCQYCFRSFRTPVCLQSHLENVHTIINSSTKCKICEWSFESEAVFLQHMKNTHKPGEMPYLCQVCGYRSSFHSDVFNHFRTWHENTRHLLCQYCLKVCKHSTSYQQHFIRHQKSPVYHCNKCRLQFISTKDKAAHKMNHHKTFRKPPELEGLQVGTKVTIRTYIQNKHQASPKMLPNPENNVTRPPAVSNGDRPSQIHAPERKQVNKMFGFLAKRELMGKHKCLECTFTVPDFANHYPTYVHCSLCLYSTCCSRAYADHMINFHGSGRIPKAAKRSPLSVLKLSCADCDYSTSLGNLMAKHLIMFPDHSSCIFSRRGKASSPDYSERFKVVKSLKDSSMDIRKVSKAGQNADVDHEMAPVEDTDLDSDSSQSGGREPQQTGNRLKETLSQPLTDKEETLSIHERQ